jgi:hypothetical protein
LFQRFPQRSSHGALQVDQQFAQLLQMQQKQKTNSPFFGEQIS